MLYSSNYNNVYLVHPNMMRPYYCYFARSLVAYELHYRNSLRKWKSLEAGLKDLIVRKFSSYKSPQITSQIWDRMSLDLSTDRVKVTEIGDSHGRTLTVTGEKAAVDHIRTNVKDSIADAKTQLEKEKQITTERIPNVPSYQIKFMEASHFFTDMKMKHGLKEMTGDQFSHVVSLTGLPAVCQAAQEDVLAIIKRLNDSKVSYNNKPPFFTVFLKHGIQAVLQMFKSKRIVAVWTIENNKRIDLYSDSRENAELAFKLISDTVCEFKYPANGSFQQPERDVLRTSAWVQFEKNLSMKFKVILAVIADDSGLSMFGLTESRDLVCEQLRDFFAENAKVTCKLDKYRTSHVRYIMSYSKQEFDEIQSQRNVSLRIIDDRVNISGSRDNVANAERDVGQLMSNIRSAQYIVEAPGMVKFFSETPERLQEIGHLYQCLLVPNEDDDLAPTHHSPDTEITKSQAVDTTDNTTLKVYQIPGSSTRLELRKGDITALADFDVLVNAANGNLEHMGGVAHAFVRAGE